MKTRRFRRGLQARKEATLPRFDGGPIGWSHWRNDSALKDLPTPRTLNGAENESVAGHRRVALGRAAAGDYDISH